MFTDKEEQWDEEIEETADIWVKTVVLELETKKKIKASKLKFRYILFPTSLLSLLSSLF